MIRELRAVSPSIAAAVVAGAALMTVGILAAIDSIGGDSPKRARAHPAKVIALDGLARRTLNHDGAAATRSPGGSGSPVPLARLVGARVMARMDGVTATPDLLARARRGEIGGVIAFPNGSSNVSALRDSIAQLQSAAKAGGGPGLLVATDQEGGLVKRLPGPPNRSPAAIGASGATRVADEEGSATGSYLANLGINVDLAPVLDVPSSSRSFISSRAFGSSATRVASLGTAFATGLEGSGVAASAKHFPGLGSAIGNTDNGRSVVTASRASLEAQLVPFRRAASAGISMVMLSTAVYPAYDGAMPAALSRAIIHDRLRRDVGFHGVVITDDLDTPAIGSFMPPAQAAVASAQAGADVVLFARTASGSIGGYAALLGAARSGKLSRRELDASYKRISALISRLGP